MLILPKITVLAPNGFSLKIAPKTTFNTKSFEIRPVGVTFRSIRPVYNGWLVNSKTNFSDLPASTEGDGRTKGGVKGGVKVSSTDRKDTSKLSVPRYNIWAAMLIETSVETV